MKNLIDNKKEEINDTNNIKVTNEKIENIEKKERITVNILNKKSRYNITSKNKSNIDESNLRNITNTIKQNVFSSKGNYYNNKEEFTKKLRKMNIRNFYKNKKSTNLKY